MLASDWIELLDLHLLRHGALVLGRGVEVTGAGAGLEFDFFTHDRYSLDLLASGTQVSQNGIDAILVDRAQCGVSDTQADPAVLALYPEFAILQIRQETTLGLVISVGYVIPNHTRAMADSEIRKDRIYTMKMRAFSSQIMICLMFPCAAEAAFTALASGEFIYDVEAGLHDRHNHQLGDTLQRIEDEGLLATVPA
jgi:hypothetical protein